MSDVRRPTSGVRGPEDRFDSAINRAVREMLDVEPPPNLRARVIEKLLTSCRLPAAGCRLPATGFRLPASGCRLPASRLWLAVPLGAAAVIVLAVLLARRVEPPAAPAAVASAADRYLPLEPVAGPERPQVQVARGANEAPSVSGAGNAPQPATRARGTVFAALDADDAAAVVIDPLTSIAPIAVAPIAQNAIAPGDIAVRPLDTIAEMQIPPLAPPDRRH
jgi:hypothetical protein